MKFLVSQTYNEVTPESAEHGDFSETGFVFESQIFTLDELKYHIKHNGFYREDKGTSWLTTGFDTICYKTCTSREDNLHVELLVHANGREIKQLNFNNYKKFMTTTDLKDLFDLLSSGLRQKNRELLKRRLSHEQIELIPYYGILDRLIKENGSWSYCAGQSYPDEIRAVRKIILECR